MVIDTFGVEFPCNSQEGAADIHEGTAAEAEDLQGQVQLPTSFARAANPNRP